jgi:MFS family permease
MVLLVLLYVAFFAIGSGPVTWVVLSEVLPPAIKGPAASLATAAAWTGGPLCIVTQACVANFAAVRVECAQLSAWLLLAVDLHC